MTIINPKRLTPKARRQYFAAKIQRMVMNGLTVKAISESLKISPRIVYKIRRDELGHKALESGPRKIGGIVNPYNPPKLKDWVLEENIILDGEPFTFTHHEYLEEPYSIDHPFVVSEKAAQMGLTSWAMLTMIWRAKFRMTSYRGIIYLFPSRWDVSEFSKGRVTPLIEDNPTAIGEGIKDTDSTTMKRIWNTLLYFRGMRSRLSLKCHDDQTEILTKTGWKLFKDVTVDDEIATRSPSGIFMWQTPTHIHKYHHKGTMLMFQGLGLDFVVTPNHRLLLTSNQNKKREWLETAERVKTTLKPHTAIVRTCNFWDGEIPSFINRDRNWYSITIKGNFKNNRWEHCGRNPDRKISLRDFVAFLGLYVAEGCCGGVASGIMKGGRVGISQKRSSRHWPIINALLKRTGLDWRYSKSDFRVGDVELAKILFPLGNKYTKHLPDWVMNLPKRYLEVLWKWAVIGDGHTDKSNHTSYATVSKKLADQLQEILQKCGKFASILVQKEASKSSTFPDGRKAKQTCPLYLVSLRKARCSLLSSPKEIPYDGEVFCVSVPNGIIYTRRNGFPIWSGNSTPADFIIFDELDEAPMKNIEMAMKRMSHSQFKEVIMLSNPTLPDYGINKMFQRSDSRYWLLKCHKCNQYTCMEDTFPDCIDLLHGKAVRLCQSCRDAELNPSIGQWVAKKPLLEEKRGYHFSQLFSHFVTPTELYDEFRSTTNPREFFNLSIGVPYIEAQNRLSLRDTLDLCSNDGIVERDSGPCSMGVDQGKGLHVVIGRKHEGKRGKVIHLGIYKEWEELYKLMDQFNVNRCVVDAQPEMRNARKMTEKFPGRVYMNFYRETQKGKYKWDEKEYMVTCNRTESLDNSHHEILMGQVILPSENLDIVKEFAEHLHSVAKNIEDEMDKDGNKTGNKRAVYVKLGDDHFRHAFNYECMARQFSENLLCEWAQ